MKDPLSGQREAINGGTAWSLLWPDKTGKDKYPVHVGQVLHLRSCAIEITKLERVRRKDGEKMMRAAFARYPKAGRPEYLALRRGQTKERKQAMRLQDDPQPGNLMVIRDEERDPVARLQHEALGEPAEPAVPKEEIQNLKGSREARQLYEREMAERRVAESKAPLEERLAVLRAQSASRHIDISPQLRIIEKQVAKAERKVLEQAA